MNVVDGDHLGSTRLFSGLTFCDESAELRTMYTNDDLVPLNLPYNQRESLDDATPALS